MPNSHVVSLPRVELVDSLSKHFQNYPLSEGWRLVRGAETLARLSRCLAGSGAEHSFRLLFSP